MKFKSRLFFALKPAEELSLKLLELGCTLKSKSHERVTEPEMLHMTLRYIGHTDEEIKQSLLTDVDSISVPSFDIRLNRTGYWKKPQVIWCAPEITDNILIKLVSQLEEICQKNGINAEKKLFKPHVSLLRKVKSFNAESQVKLPLWRVSDFVLLESISTGNGVQYNELKRWNLI